MILEHSKNFEKVRKYFEENFWNENRIHLAVGRWITEEEYEEITGKAYQNPVT